MEQNKSSLVLIISIVVSLLVGGAGGYFLASSSYEKEIASAQKYFPTVSDVRSISGKVTNVNGNTVTIKTEGFGNPFEKVPTTRNVLVTDTTSITKNEQIDPIELQKEITAYQNSISANVKNTSTPPLQPPAMYKQTVLNVGDIKVGDVITVTAGENIKMLTDFNAVSIVVNPAGTPLSTANTPAALVAPQTFASQPSTSGGSASTPPPVPVYIPPPSPVAPQTFTTQGAPATQTGTSSKP